MEIPNGGTLDLAGLIHPRVEPEVAFRLGASLPAGASEADLVAAIDAVAPALEIIDSRYRDFRFSLPDVVADNTSACRYVIGEWQAPGTILADRAVTLSVDDAAVEHGSTSDILGDPLRTLPRLAAMSAKYGFGFRAGSVILAGAATAAVALTPGVRVSAVVDGLGTVTLETRGGQGA
jgi:2-oxo-3-hexenedioate decarboxylase